MRAFIELLFNQLGIEVDGTGGGNQIVAPYKNNTGFCIINPTTFDLHADVIAAAKQVGFSVDPRPTVSVNKETGQIYEPSIHFRKPRTTSVDDLASRLG